MTRKRKAGDDDLILAMKKAIMEVLADPKATVAEKIQMITAGSKLVIAEGKTANADKGSGYFGD